MEPHMIDNEIFSYLFVIWINHVGFMFIEFIFFLYSNSFSSSAPFFKMVAGLHFFILKFPGSLK